MTDCVVLILATLMFGLPIKACEIPPPHAGFAVFYPKGGGEVRIAKRYADSLISWAPIRRLTAQSVYVLAHELGHLANRWAHGPFSEAVADTWAAKNWCRIAKKFGYDKCWLLWQQLPKGWRWLGTERGIR